MPGRTRLDALMDDPDQAPPAGIFGADARSAQPGSQSPAADVAASVVPSLPSPSSPAPPAGARQPTRSVLGTRRNRDSAGPTAGQIDDEVRERWRWQLGATARKAAAGQRRAAQATAAWERLVADARQAGVPEVLLLAAASDAEVELPSGRQAR